MILAFYESFESLSTKKSIKKALVGVNSGVVALLFAVLINTVFPSAVYSIFDFLAVLIGLFILKVYKTNIFFLILGFILFGFVKTFFNF